MLRFAVAAGLCLALVASAGSAAHAAKEYRVAFVTVTDGVGTPIMQQSVAGLRQAAQDFDVEITVLVQPARTSWTSTFVALARQQYDLVIAPFPNQAPAVLAAARAYPDQRFVLGDTRAAEWTGLLERGLGPWPPNVQGLSAREEEIGFVVGYLAGLVERRRPGRDAVGSVGGGFVPAVDRFIAGFRAGAKRASPSIRRLNGYSHHFGDPER